MVGPVRFEIYCSPISEKSFPWRKVISRLIIASQIARIFRALRRSIPRKNAGKNCGSHNIRKNARSDAGKEFRPFESPDIKRGRGCWIPRLRICFSNKAIQLLRNIFACKLANAKLEGGRRRGLKIWDGCDNTRSERHEDQKSLVKRLADLWWRSRLNLLPCSSSVDMNPEGSFTGDDWSPCIEIYILAKRTAN